MIVIISYHLHIAGNEALQGAEPHSGELSGGGGDGTETRLAGGSRERIYGKVCYVHVHVY